MIFYVSNAQIIENKISISLGYETAKFFGKTLMNDKNFKYPSLFANYKKVSGISCKGLIKLDPYIILGAGLNYIQASAWNTSRYKDYIDSKIELYSLSPVIQIHNKYFENGFSNKLRVLLEIGPTFGKAKISLEKPIFDIENEGQTVTHPLKSSDLFYGLRGGLILELTLNQAFGIYFENSVNHNWVSSKLYNDKHFTGYHLGLGLILRLGKDKRFFY